MFRMLVLTAPRFLLSNLSLRALGLTELLFAAVAACMRDGRAVLFGGVVSLILSSNSLLRSGRSQAAAYGRECEYEVAPKT